MSGLSFENGYTNEGCAAVADGYVGSRAVLNSMDVCVRVCVCVCVCVCLSVPECMV